MEGKKLLRILFAAIWVVWGMNYPLGAMAQTWTGNAPQEGDFYLYNVGAGKFLTSGCWWGTHAAMDYDGMLLTFAGSGNDYTLSTNVAFANCYVGDNAYMDNGSAATWTFTQVSAGKYTMKNGSNYLVFKGGDVADTDNTAPTTDAGYWQIVSRADLINNMKSATPSSPVDASFFMENPKIRRNWKNSKPFSGTGITDNGSFNASSETLYGGGCTSVGQYRKTFDNYQVLTGLPNGKYQVTVKGFNRLDGGNNNTAAYMYANNSTITLPTMGNIGTENAENATRALVDDTYLSDPVTVTVTDGNLRVGVKCDANCGWVTWREFTVKFLDPALSFLAETLPSADVEDGKWYAIEILANGEYTISSTNAASIFYTQDGSQLASNISSLSNKIFAAGDETTISLDAGVLYLKSDAATTLSIEASSYRFTEGQDITSLIVNPSFESNGEVVNLSSENLTEVTGWTLLTAANTNDIGTRAYSDNTYSALNGVGNYCFNSYWEGKPLTQDIDLPAGTYELSALVTTGNESSVGTVFLNAGNVHSTGFSRKSAHTNFFYRERLVFTLTAAQTVTIGVRGGSDVADGATKGTWVENGYWWYKCDDFRLVYLSEPTQSSLYSQLQTLVNQRQPWTSGDDYATRYATYSAYTALNTVEELTTAIDYLNNEFERYALAHATNTNPYDVGAVVNANYSSGQDGWSTTNNQTGGGSYAIASDGKQSNYFNSSYNSWMRHSTVYQEGIVLDEGIYRLSAKMKGTPKDDVSTFIYGTTGAVAHWEDPVFKGTTFYGYLTQSVASSWSTVEAYLPLDAPTSLRIGVLSWGNNWNGGTGGAFAVDDWKIDKIDYAVTMNNGIVTAVGAAPISEINASLNSNVAAVNLQQATGISSASISTTYNPNMLIYAKDAGQVDNTKNVIVEGICSNLELQKSNTSFIVPTGFTATTANYTLTSAELAGGSFATLMLPFAAALPSGGAAYTLDQGVNLIDGNIRGTSVSSIAANSPVLVTAAGDYTATNAAIPAIASGATYTNGELVGTYSAVAAPASSYVLQNHINGEGVAFYLVGSTQPTVNPFRAYIKAQSNNVKAIHVAFGEDGINEIANDESSKGQWYNLAGQRLSKPLKGVNIVNGKKVIIK